jgi:hypothetical protein
MEERLSEIFERLVETREVDFKKAFPWTTSRKSKGEARDASSKLVKDIVAMANTLGGLIVVGVSEDEVTGEFTLDGVPDDLLSTWETTKLCDFVNSRVAPQIDANVRVASHGGKNYVLIEIPPFPREPHLITKELSGEYHHGDLLIRDAGAKSRSIVTYEEMRDFLDRAIRQRQDSFLEQIRQIFISRGDNAGRPSPVLLFEKLLEETRHDLPTDFAGDMYREFWAYPSEYSSERFPWEELEKICMEASVNYTGWPFLFIPPSESGESGAIDNGFESNMKLYHPNRRVLWKFMTSGFFYHVRKARPHETKEHALSTDSLWQEVALGIDCIARLYSQIGDAEQVTFGIRWSGVKDWRLTSPRDEDIWERNFRARQDTIEHIRSLPLVELRTGKFDLAVDTYERFCRLFGWSTARGEVVKPHIQETFAYRHR